MALQNDDLASFLKQYPRLSPDIDNNKDEEEPDLKLIVFDQFEDFFGFYEEGKSSMKKQYIDQFEDFFGFYEEGKSSMKKQYIRPIA